MYPSCPPRSVPDLSSSYLHPGWQRYTSHGESRGWASCRCLVSGPRWVRSVEEGAGLEKQRARWIFRFSGLVTLATSYFHTPYRCTIIGAAAFHFRVRNGNGWDHCAMVTRSLDYGAFVGSGCSVEGSHSMLLMTASWERSGSELKKEQRVFRELLNAHCALTTTHRV